MGEVCHNREGIEMKGNVKLGCAFIVAGMAVLVMGMLLIVILALLDIP